MQSRANTDSRKIWEQRKAKASQTYLNTHKWVFVHENVGNSTDDLYKCGCMFNHFALRLHISISKKKCDSKNKKEENSRVLNLANDCTIIVREVSQIYLSAVILQSYRSCRNCSLMHEQWPTEIMGLCLYLSANADFCRSVLFAEILVRALYSLTFFSETICSYSDQHTDTGAGNS